VSIDEEFFILGSELEYDPWNIPYLTFFNVGSSLGRMTSPVDAALLFVKVFLQKIYPPLPRNSELPEVR
jgi:hypothetical protein